MAVICDATKVGVIADRTQGYLGVRIKGLRNQNGHDVKFSVTKDMSLSAEEVLTLFFEKLEKGEFKQNARTGGGTLRQDDNGNYYLDYGKSSESVSQKPTEKPRKVEYRQVQSLGTKTLFDTHAPEVRALIGSPVIGSSTYAFSEGTCAKGVLESVNGLFHIRTADGMFSCPFIRERKPEPLNLNDASVRRNLLGTIVVAKDKSVELLLCSAVKGPNGWKLNGLSSNQLMNEYTYEDGSDIVASA